MHNRSSSPKQDIQNKIIESEKLNFIARDDRDLK